jgi:hypothetical protein
MTRYYILLFCAFAFSGLAQKHDQVWLMGQNSDDILVYSGTVIDFFTTPPDVYYEYRDMFFSQANASICDTAGNLLFYTNGVYIANALNEVMENGEGLNPGAHADAQSEYDRGYILGQGVTIIPIPEDDKLYYLLHLDIVLPEDNSGIPYSSKHFYSTLIDMSLESNLGSVIEKNVIISNQNFESGYLTSTRHANGRDWWILLRGFDSNRYYSFLVTPNGIVEKSYQDIGDSIPSPGLGQAVFSPDGTRFANLHLVNGIGTDDYIGIYDFDRCTGTLSDPTIIAYSDSAWAGGVAISPNSRYLYVSSYLNVYQYDLWADDIESSRDTVAIWDGYLEDGFFATTFYLAQLAPDGKIYINSNNGARHLHVIENPDLPGDSCNVCQHCFEIPSWNAFSLPNFPNYRLQHLEGSPCDTLRALPIAAFSTLQESESSFTFMDDSYHDIRSWHWDFGDGQTDSIPNPTHAYEIAGAYEVCLTVTNPRGADTYCQTVQVLTDVQEVMLEALVMSPNPTSGSLRLQLPATFTSGRLYLYDATGRHLRTYPINYPKSTLELSLEAYESGVYLIQLESAEGVKWRGRVVLQR